MTILQTYRIEGKIVAILYFVEYGKVQLDVASTHAPSMKEKVVEYSHDMGRSLKIVPLDKGKLSFEVSGGSNENLLRFDFPKIVEGWFKK